MSQANELFDSNVAHHIRVQQVLESDRQKAYLRKALSAKYSSPVRIQQSRMNQSREQKSFGEVEIICPLKSAETEIRSWVGLPERGITPEKLLQFKRNLAIGILSTLVLFGIMLTPPTQANLDSKKQPESNKIKEVVKAQTPIAKENVAAESISSESVLSESLDQDSNTEPFDESKTIMQAW